MARWDVRYSEMPEAVKHNLTEDQFELARIDIVEQGELIPETTEYVDLASGLHKIFHAGEPAPDDLLPAHDLSGARGKNYSQWDRVHRF